MKKRLQGMISGIIIGTMLTSGIVYAKQIKETAELFYNNIKISLNGQYIQPQDANGNPVEPFIINGTTYLPVRAVANALGVNVDWDGNNNTVVLSNQKPESNAIGFNATSVASGISIVNEYRWNTDYYNYAAVIIKNTSARTISPRIQISFKDKNGNIVGAQNKSEHAFGPGNEMAFVFSNEEPFEKVEYIISASEEEYYDECVSKLECSSSTTDKKVILQVKNKATKPAKFVECLVLFKNGNNVVDYNSTYCVDNDSEIKANATEMKEISVSYGKKFDSVEIYLTGRAER